MHLIKMQYTELLTGTRLKNITNKQFLKNKKLIRKYGKYNDSDNDGLLNYKDCRPFNFSRQDEVKYTIIVKGDRIGYSQSEYDLAKRLILTGKTYAADDSRTRNLINYMIEHGWQSMTPEAIERREEMTQIRQEEEKAKLEELNKSIGANQVVPEGYQGMTTKEGVIYTPITPTNKLQEVIAPTPTQLTPYIEQPKQVTNIIQIPPSIQPNIISQLTGTKKEEAKIDFKVMETNIPTKSTISTQPQVNILPISYGTPTPFLKQLERDVTGIRDYITGLPVRDIRKENEAYVYTPQRVTVPRKETITYAPPMLSTGGRIESELEKKEVLEQFKAETKLNTEAEKITSRYRKEIDNYLKDKDLSQEEIDKYVAKKEEEANKEIKQVVTDVSKIYEENVISKSKELQARQKKEEGFLSESFYRRRAGDVLGAGLYAIPVYGQTLLAMDVKNMIANPKETLIEPFKEDPVEFISSGLTYGIVGGGIAKGKSVYKQGKITEAISKSKVELKSYGTIKDDYGLGQTKIKLLPEKGYERYTPEVKGSLIDISKRIDERTIGTSTGKIESSYGGKKSVTKLLSNTVSEFKDNLASSYTETATLNKKSGTLSRYFSESKVKETKTGEGFSASLIESQTGIISKERFKPKSENVFNRYEGLSMEEAKKSAKKVSETKTISISEDLLKDNKVIGERYGSYSLKESAKGTPNRLLTFTKETVKKENGIVSEPSNILRTRDRPSSYVKKEIIEQERPTPSYVGGKGGVLSIGQEYGKSYLVKGFIEQEVKGIAKSFAKDVARPSYLSAGLSSLTGSKISQGTYKLRSLGFEGTKFKQGEKSKLSTGQSSITELKSKDKNRSRDRGIEKNDLGFRDENKLIDRTKIIDETGLRDEVKLRDEVIPRIIDITKLREDNINRQDYDYDYSGDGRKGDDSSFDIIYPEEDKPVRPKEYRRERYSKQQGYDAYVYIDSVKKPYWQKINKQPLTKGSAIGEVAEVVDNTISARGKITKSRPMFKKGKEIRQDVISTRNDYYDNNKYKFRQFRQVKGVREKLPNQIIELQKYRLDRPRETKRIVSSKKSSIRNMFGI